MQSGEIVFIPFLSGSIDANSSFVSLLSLYLSPTGPPHSVHDCLIVNVTMTSFVLKCIAGENGGLRQIFHLEVYNIGKNIS